MYSNQFLYLVITTVETEYWNYNKQQRLRRSKEYQIHPNPVEMELDPKNFPPLTPFKPPKGCQTTTLELQAA